MKYFVLILMLLSGVAYGQTRYYIRADSTVLEKNGGSNELVIKNDTRDSLGALVNIGGGKTSFQRFRQSGDTLFLGLDTVIIVAGGASGGIHSANADYGLTQVNDSTLEVDSSLIATKLHVADREQAIRADFPLRGGFDSEISPAQITSNQNNYSPTGLTTSGSLLPLTIRLESDAARNLTGIDASTFANGKVVIIHNVGDDNITLVNSSASSTAENRFLFLEGDVVLASGGSAMLRYDATTDRWRSATNSVSITGGYGTTLSTGILPITSIGSIRVDTGSLKSQYWSLRGNVAGVGKYIGFSDSSDIHFQINGIRAGWINTQPLGGNTTFGFRAGTSSPSGAYNTLIGYYVAPNITGSQNTMIGTYSGWDASGTPSENVGVGNGTLGKIQGIRNVAVGASAMAASTTAEQNTSTGNYSMLQNRTGDYNTADGTSALRGNVDGSHNTAIGSVALTQNTTAIASIAVTNGGSGYTTATVVIPAPTVGSDPGNNSLQATATATINSGAITAVTVTQPGKGYTGTVTATITGDGSGATLSVTLTSGIGNTAIGSGSMSGNRTGKYNVAVGYNAGNGIQGDYNVYIGGNNANTYQNHSRRVVFSDGEGTIRQMHDSSAGGWYVPDLTTAPGTRALRYDPATGKITLGDTATAGVGSGTVTSVATNNGTGITGGTITGSGTIAADTANVLATRAQVQHRIDSLAATGGGGGGSPAGNFGNIQLNRNSAFDTPASDSLSYVSASGLTVKNVVNGNSFRPNANDGGALGTTSLQFSDLFLAEGGVINFDNGDVTITQTGNVLSFAGAATRYEFDAGVRTPYIYGGNMTTTYAGYEGGVFGGTASHGVLDFVDNGTRIGEFYTTSSDFNFFSTTGKGINFYSNNSTGTPLIRMSSSAPRVGINLSSPTAQLHVAAGTATAGSAPFKFTSGTDLTTAEAGALEFGSSRLAFTPSGTTRKRVALTNDVTPSNGQIPIGNGTDFTAASVTSSGSTITITPGAGTLNIEVANPPASGTVTPTLTNTTNITSSATYGVRYIRVGDVVYVAGSVDIRATGTGAVELRMTVPVTTSSFGTDKDADGVGSTTDKANGSLGIMAVSGTQLVAFKFVADDTSDHNYRFEYSYTILPG